MALSHFRMLNNELFNKDPGVVPEQAPIKILDSKISIRMANNCKYIKHTIHIHIIIHLERNCEEFNFHKTVWFEGGKQLAYIGTKNLSRDELDPRLWYAMVILDNWQNTCQRGVTGYRRVWRMICSKWIDWIEWSIRPNAFEIFIWVYHN